MAKITILDAMDRWPDCTDGGDIGHYHALIEFGQCPWCGLTDDDNGGSYEIADSDTVRDALEGRR